ncbi:hypothetical protein [Nocardioides sp. SR21]|uniref:hypothetical protein n=1 Tax=Nocardioides sp. SR21 TaxID=2919501 RepID=UPI001FA9A7B3|nr:hypothetical protein [Nocardioides sp. SR21]
MTVWLVPTARAISWWPLVAVAALLAGASALAERTDFPVVGLLGIAAAALAAAVVAGLHDAAAALLSAVPTSLAVRRARRLLLLLPVELAASWASGLNVPLGGLVALTAAGVAVAFWAGPLAGAAVPLAWVVVARAGGFAWDQHLALVTIAAAAALWTGRNR